MERKIKSTTGNRTSSLWSYSATAQRCALALLCGLLLVSSSLAQEGRPAPPPEPTTPEAAPSEKPPDPNKDVIVGPQDNQVVDGDIVFTSPGAFTYPRDIRLSDNFGGLRFYGAPSLTTSPAGAAIQFFGNNAAPFNGQLYLDSGADSSAALIFRTAPTGGTITERMRVTAFGNVGIGTNAPVGALDVRGSIRLGFSGELRAPGGVENLRIIRGVVDGAGNIIVGSGFTAARNGTGLYTITFSTAFAGPPAVMAAAEQDTQVRTINTAGVTSGAANFRAYFGTGLSDVAFHFIAVGPR